MSREKDRDGTQEGEETAKPGPWQQDTSEQSEPADTAPEDKAAADDSVAISDDAAGSGVEQTGVTEAGLPPGENEPTAEATDLDASDPDAILAARDAAATDAQRESEADAAEAQSEAQVVDPTTESQPTLSSTEKRSGGSGWIIVLIIAVAIGASGFFAWPYLLGRATDWLPSALVAAIQSDGETKARLDTIEADVAGLKSQAEDARAQLSALQSDIANLPQGSGGADPRFDDLAQSLATLRDTIDELQASNQDLSERVETLTTAAAGATAGGMAEAAEALQSGVAERLSAADARAEAAESRAEAAVSRAEAAEQLAQVAQSRLQALENRLAALEATPSRTPVDEQRAAILALGQLRDAVDAGRPYAAALSTVESVFASADDLAPLRDTANTGLVTLSELKARFPDTIEAVLHARPEGGNIWDRTLDRLTSLVTVRRIGNVEGEETDAILARAEVRLNASDLAGAVEELRALDGPAAEAAQSWLQDAAARVEAERTLNALQDRVIAKTAAG